MRMQEAFSFSPEALLHSNDSDISVEMIFFVEYDRDYEAYMIFTTISL